MLSNLPQSHTLLVLAVRLETFISDGLVPSNLASSLQLSHLSHLMSHIEMENHISTKLQLLISKYFGKQK